MGDSGNQPGRALITGCCGFIGSHLATNLLNAGWTVDGVDDMSNGTVNNVDHLRESHTVRVVPSMLIPAYEHSHESERTRNTFLVFEGDFCNPAILKRIVEKRYDVVFHLAAEPSVEISVKNPSFTAFNNLQKTTELMSVCVGAVRRIVFASSAAVYGENVSLPAVEVAIASPASPYALQKLHVEDTARLFNKLYGLEFVALRMFNVYGPRQSGSTPYSTVVASWCDKLKSGESLRLDGDGEQSRDLIFIDDVCDAFKMVAETSSTFGYEVFNVATGEAYTNNYILSLLKKFRPELKVNQAPPRIGDVRHSVASVKKINDAIGFKRKVVFEEGLERTLRSWDLIEE